MYTFKLKDGYNIKRLISQYGFFYTYDNKRVMYKKDPTESGLTIYVDTTTRYVHIYFDNWWWYDLPKPKVERVEETNELFARLLNNKVIVITRI